MYSPGSLATYLKLVYKYYNFVIFQHMLCKTYDESLQKQVFNMDLQCILCIANSSYAVRKPKDKVYWNFYKNLKIWTCFPQNGRFWDQTGDGRQPLKTGGRVGTYDRGWILTLTKNKLCLNWVKPSFCNF